MVKFDSNFTLPAAPTKEGYEFGIGKQFFQFSVPGVFFIKKVGKTTPAHILCQHSLFLRCGGAVLRLHGFQGTDRVQIALKTLQRCALSDVVIGDAVVAAVRVQRIGKRVLLFLSASAVTSTVPSAYYGDGLPV